MENDLIKTVNEATFWWKDDNKSDINLSSINWLFKAGEALFNSVCILQQITTKKTQIPVSVNGENNFFFMFPFSSDGYFYLRGTLAMTADLYRISEALLKSTDLTDLKPSIQQVKKASNKFRDLRNFFEHIDDRLINLDKHGIEGELNTNCGIQYGADTKNCFHLIYDGNGFHFSDEKKAKERSFMAADFIPIFEGLNSFYDVVTSHESFKQSYPSFSSFLNYDSFR